MTTEDEKEVNNELANLDRVAAYLIERIKALESRLEPVLSLNVVDDPKDTSAPEAGICPVAHTVRLTRYELENATVTVERTIDALQV
jgi:hypothetical protein